MRRPRLRSALLVAAVLSAGIPTIALAQAPALHCGAKLHGSWETIHIDSFKPVQSMSSPDSVSAWTVDETRPQDLAATNGVRVQTTSDHGCDWADSLVLKLGPGSGQSFAGAQAKIVSLALLGSTHVAAVQEGTGAASRPHIMVGTGGSWTTADSGLPAQGAPKLLRAANDGRTLYLTISPTGSSGGSSGGTTGLPGLPTTGGGVGNPAGLLYASTDRGHTWSLRTTANELPSGAAGFTALDVDSSDSNRLYGILNGRLEVSANGGSTFTAPLGNTDLTALTAMGPLTVAAFSASGRMYYSGNAGGSFTNFAAPGGVTSVGYRDGDNTLMIERNGLLQRLTPFTHSVVDTPAGSQPRPGSLTGDRGSQSSFHALSGHSLLRYVDPVPPGTTIPPIAVGDTSVPPPVPGTVVPAAQSVTLQVGSTATVPFRLDLPKNPTPLDLYFLVDASGSMSDYIQSLKANINRIVGSLTFQHVDLKVGVATLGSGEHPDERPYPETYVYPTQPKRPYHKPVIYRRIRAVGQTGAELQAAVNAITIQSDDIPPTVGGGGREGQLLALRQLMIGDGIHTWAESQVHSGTYLDVPPGQNAGFRGSPAVRKIVIMATDEAFDNPYPQQNTPGGALDFSAALGALNAKHVQVIGLSAGSLDSLADLRHVASGTHSVAPPGGVYCGIDPNTDLPERIAPGQPLVCSSGNHFDDAIIRLLASLVDRQSVALVPLSKSPVLGSAQGSALVGLNVKKPNAASFTVNVSCVDVKPGRYGGDIAAVLRGTKVGQAHVNVTCLKANAAVPPRPIPPVNPPAPPAPQPAAPAVPPLAPPAPAVQPQVQIQTQVQVNPMTAGALQEQQELQLALALNGTLKDDDPAFNAGTQLAMVDRRKHEAVQAGYVLAVAMTACAGLGLARLRAKPEPRVRRAS
ncbi:MAG: exo-alpha-sialidase [Frankiales bacterium]|nr:exo-alpha-sialidase [Frankiales bacterium]